MTAYVDSSVLLRLVLGERGPLADWPRVSRGVTSALTEVECLRTLDRRRLRGGLSVAELAEAREAVYRFVAATDVVALDLPVVQRAGQPFPTPLGTLDALHLATALLARERYPDLAMATHDVDLALAAKACGLAVLG
ncbi:MAG: PIN domain-containing protein [Myxococcales bacterium]